MNNLLSREQFKANVFSRDNNLCVVCGDKAVDAHHIIDRALWHDGGYYMSNGASVCSPCHIKCETTEFSVEHVRNCSGITSIIVPDNMDLSLSYDKWGNEILVNGMRMKSEMFFKDGVQKLLRKANMLELFTDYIKYPRTPHLPFSEGATNDDKVLSSISHFEGKEVVISEKMDGENTTMYHQYIHARSIDSKNHPSRNLLKQFHASISIDIPFGMRVCGENMYAKHSIYYTNLQHHFLGFSIWDEKNTCLSVNETLEWFELLGITPAPIIFRGMFDERKVTDICRSLDLSKQEGIVIRLASSFKYSDFQLSLAKFVRKGHVETGEHWMKAKIIPNIFNTTEGKNHD